MTNLTFVRRKFEIIKSINFQIINESRGELGAMGVISRIEMIPVLYKKGDKNDIAKYRNIEHS